MVGLVALVGSGALAGLGAKYLAQEGASTVGMLGAGGSDGRVRGNFVSVRACVSPAEAMKTAEERAQSRQSPSVNPSSRSRVEPNADGESASADNLISRSKIIFGVGMVR